MFGKYYVTFIIITVIIKILPNYFNQFLLCLIDDHFFGPTKLYQFIRYCLYRIAKLNLYETNLYSI